MPPGKLVVHSYIYILVHRWTGSNQFWNTNSSSTNSVTVVGKVAGLHVFQLCKLTKHSYYLKMVFFSFSSSDCAATI